MDEKYKLYLKSPEWLSKREERLEIGKHVCAACGSRTSLDVHHLTYDRLYNEEMADLVPLCRNDHRRAERLIEMGYVPRNGNPLYLLPLTVKYLCKPLPKKPAMKNPNASQPVILKAPEKPSDFPYNAFQIQSAICDNEEFINLIKKSSTSALKKGLKSKFPDCFRFVSNTMSIHTRWSQFQRLLRKPYDWEDQTKITLQDFFDACSKK